MFYHRFIVLTCLLAFAVILLGAYTRLGDAGLGCPDWPGCYGHLTVPASEEHVADKRYLDQRALEPEKGWKEMVHRYFAGSLGLAILAITVWSWVRRRDDPDQPVWLPTLLLATVVFQAALGMWTVTLLLKPIIVMGHLLGGFATFSLLVLLALRTAPRRPVVVRNDWRIAGIFGIVILVGQIALGGWTSSNYAALACTDFPTCQGSWVPDMDFDEAFVMWRGLGVNYEYGVLEHPARTAIHVTHRIGAVVTLAYLVWLVIGVWRNVSALSGAAMLVGVLLLAQVSLGIANVLLHLPLGIATAHNGVAALLLASLINLNFRLWQRPH
ncbi:MAG: COX15/CtaA family protein [Chromatiaceae bacterium]|nr:COX15/CtaA family protein [Gammaproteobacteria bacterium]MCP5300129.1 COX15/CtaA family protein [Chromatiaceae bacterium]MCP5422201.1 COX15/CtaA family protein [Chromatiaceae bacterium]